MPTYEKIMEKRGQISNPNEIQGVKGTNLIKCPHCERTFQIIVVIQSFKAGVMVPIFDRKGDEKFVSKS